MEETIRDDIIAAVGQMPLATLESEYDLIKPVIQTLMDRDRYVKFGNGFECVSMLLRGLMRFGCGFSLTPDTWGDGRGSDHLNLKFTDFCQVEVSVQPVVPGSGTQLLSQLEHFVTAYGFVLQFDNIYFLDRRLFGLPAPPVHSSLPAEILAHAPYAVTPTQTRDFFVSRGYQVFQRGADYLGTTIDLNEGNIYTYTPPQVSIIRNHHLYSKS